MALLGELRVFERLVLVLEIGARILAVGIEEEAVEAVVEVVMIGGVAPRPRGRVRGAQPPHELPKALEEVDAEERTPSLRVSEQNLDEVVDRPALDDEPSAHEQLSELQLRVEQHGNDRPVVGEADDDPRFTSIAELHSRTIRRPDHEGAVPHETGQRRVQRTL